MALSLGVLPTNDDPNVVRVGLVGRGIQQSRTPTMHRAEGAAQGIELRYELIDADSMQLGDHQLPEVLDAAEQAGFAGVNVTFPYKKSVIPHVHELSEEAQRVEAVNTIVFRAGKRLGHNTDWWGFAEGFRRGLPHVEKHCALLLGAGGAGGAVAHALRSLGVERVLVADRSREAAEALVEVLARGAPGVADVAFDLGKAIAEADGIVNATPMGMAKRPGTAIDPELLQSRHWVVDIVYFPLETELLRQAKVRGCQALGGAGMAVFQAVRAFELFTGRTADPDRMRDAFDALPEAPPAAPDCR